MRRDVFQAIADPTRRSIILLIALKAMTPNAIAEHFETTRQAVSKHLRILTECELLSQEQSGREIYYRLNATKMEEIDSWLEQFKKIWESRFNELDNVLLTLKNNKKMSINLAFDFSVDKENKRITVTREFAADRPLVWDAYTKSEILDQWWAPKPWKARTKSMDFREGGQWLYAMVGPEGEEHWSVVNYKSIQKEEQFTGADAFTDPEGNVNTEMPSSEWQVSFTEKGDDLTLVEIQSSYSDLKHLETTIQMGFKEGLSTAMEGLDALLPSLKKK